MPLPLPVMAELQTWVRRCPVLVQAIRTARNLVHFGPWRSIGLAYRRRRSPFSAPSGPQPKALIEPIDVSRAVESLEGEGFSLGARVDPALIRESASFWRNKRPGTYVDVHLQSEALARIVRDGSIREVAGRYFGCNPVLVECKLFISEVGQPDPLSSAFHFDHAGLRSLNVLAYLTPVDIDTGPHVLVAGTHRGKRLRDYLREYTSIDEIDRRFGSRIHTITGPAGTVLLENAEIFHRRLVARRPRVAMITVFSTSGRRLLSMGRDRPHPGG